MKIGVVCDNYKLDKFKKEFLKMGIKFKLSPFTNDTTTISLTVTADKVMEIKKICEKVEREKELLNYET